MTPLQFPCTIFKTQKWMNDYGASDMRCGDILKTKFSQFHFFRIGFVLQRYNQFGFKPFMTNMEATIEITGGRNDS